TEAALEFRIGAPERCLGIDAEIPAHVHETKEHIAELLLDLARGFSAFDLLPELLELLLELVEGATDAAPLEADCGCSLAELVRSRQRRQRERHIVEHAPSARLAFLALVLLPGARLLVCALDARPAEHVRMTSLHLLADGLDHLVEPESAPLAR